MGNQEIKATNTNCGKLSVRRNNVILLIGALGEIRTPDLLGRNETLYPPELPGRTLMRPSWRALRNSSSAAMKGAVGAPDLRATSKLP